MILFSPNRPRGLIRAARGRLIFGSFRRHSERSEESLNMWPCARSGGREIFAPRVPHLISCFFPLVILSDSEESLYFIVTPNVRRANPRAPAPHISPYSMTHHQLNKKLLHNLFKKMIFARPKNSIKNHFFEA